MTAGRARLTVLGSGTLLPDDRRRSPAHLLEAPGRSILLDCGSGTVHGFERHGVAWRSLSAVVFSHYHTDHIGDLAPFLFALKHGVRPARVEPITLVGPPGLRDMLDGLERAFGDHVRAPGFSLEVRELGRAGSLEAGDGLRLRFQPTNHTDRSVAHRWEGEGWSVGYSGDTGPDPGLAPFFAGVDLLVCECGVPDDSEVETHLAPRELAALARQTEPGLLVTTHVYPPLVPERVPGLIREAGYGGEVVAGTDGLAVEVGGSRPRISRAGEA